MQYLQVKSCDDESEMEALRWARAGLEAETSLQAVVTDTGRVIGSSSWIQSWEAFNQEQQPPATAGVCEDHVLAAVSSIIGAEHAASALGPAGLPYRARVVFKGGARAAWFAVRVNLSKVPLCHQKKSVAADVCMALLLTHMYSINL